MTDISALLIKSPEWHARRRKYIGGSDVTILMSGDQAKIYELWQVKRGEKEPDDLLDVLPVLMGVATEELNLWWFERKTGLKVARKNQHVVAADHPFMACTLDGFVAEENAVVQAKHVGGFEPFDDIVERYTPQMIHEAICTGADKAYLSCFIGSAGWARETVPFDPFYAAALVEAEAEFWACVQSGKPPCPPPPIPVPAGEASRVVDMTTSNSWASNANVWLETKESGAKCDKAKEELKALVESDVKRAFGHRVEINRDRRGSLRLKELRS